MRRLALVPLLALPLACADQTVLQPDDAPLAGVNGGSGRVIAMVTGSGHFTPTIGVNADAWRTFSLTARKYADGSVRGSYVRTAHREGEPAVTNKGVITCFTVVGNTAWVGGYDTESAEPNDVGWQAVDNGEGANDPPDQMGLQIVASAWGYPAGFTEDFCDETPTELDFGPPFGVLPLTVVLHDIEGGNVQIMAK